MPPYRNGIHNEIKKRKEKKNKKTGSKSVCMQFDQTVAVYSMELREMP